MAGSGRRVHLISGLPRSGSTLLSALLQQNPNFHAGVTSPVAMLCTNLLHGMSGAREFSSFFSDEKRHSVIASVFEGYYRDAGRDVIFDTNRTWTGLLPLIAAIFPKARVICCVRDVSWIIDSIERLVRANMFQPSKLFDFKTGGSVYSRVNALMEPASGLVGLAWSTLREAWFSEEAKRLVLVDYESLSKTPDIVMRRLYECLEEPFFQHDFENLAFDSPSYDEDLGMPGLHRVRRAVGFQPRQSCLPPDLFTKYGDVNFWKKPVNNVRGVITL
jgi:sulfotransferase